METSQLSAAPFSAGLYSCGVPAKQVVVWVGANTELEKYRALMDMNGLIFHIFFVDLMVSKLTFLLFLVQKKQRCSA